MIRGLFGNLSLGTNWKINAWINGVIQVEPGGLTLTWYRPICLTLGAFLGGGAGGNLVERSGRRSGGFHQRWKSSNYIKAHKLGVFVPLGGGEGENGIGLLMGGTGGGLLSPKSYVDVPPGMCLPDLENLTIFIPIFCQISYPWVYHFRKKRTQFWTNWVLFTIVCPKYTQFM